MAIHIHNLDLHYHAGQERGEDITVSDHLRHARLTGRRVLGVTDHLGFYVQPGKPGRHYESSVEGLRKYRKELDSLKPDFPELTLLFAPEIGPAQNLQELPDEVIDISDFFIGEASFPGDDIQENTDGITARLTELRDFADAVGREVFLAHPFRNAVNRRLIKRDAEPWVTALPPDWNHEFTLEEIKNFFFLDLAAIARTAARCRISLEVNGNTQFRIRSSNLPAPLQMLWQAYAYLRDQGVDLVPGSDQHGFMAGIGRIGGAVPADCFNFLGLKVENIRFLTRLRIRVDRSPAPAAGLQDNDTGKVPNRSMI